VSTLMFMPVIPVILTSSDGHFKKNLSFVNPLTLLPNFLNFANVKSLDFTKVNGRKC